MTANNASSAPMNLPDEPNESNDPSDEDDDTKNEVEEFFANLAYAEDDEPVRILANMMSDDLLMIPGATNSASPALPEPRGENLHTLRNLCNATDTRVSAMTLQPVTKITYSSSSSVFDDEYEHGVQKRPSISGQITNRNRTTTLDEPDLSPEEEQIFEGMAKANDKWESAIAMQPWTKEEVAARRIASDRRSASPIHQLQPLSYVDSFRAELKSTADVDKQT